ncbi:hypothetical protein J1614_011485 [Plenodomus biglobosus]|nr:hypothetical protein J1614_011485 [Plenodomus biglobosus]
MLNHNVAPLLLAVARHITAGHPSDARPTSRKGASPNVTRPLTRSLDRFLAMPSLRPEFGFHAASMEMPSSPRANTMLHSARAAFRLCITWSLPLRSPFDHRSMVNVVKSKVVKLRSLHGATQLAL